MHPKFAEATASLHSLFERLVISPPRDPAAKWPSGRVRGVYLFSEDGVPLYVGRTNDVKGRYGRHCRPGATWRMAAFAFRLAREATNRTQATYRADQGSRKALAADPTFAVAFSEAKARIRDMDFRFVEEADPIRQCLLEVYCAVALETRYNDFDNH